MSVSIRIVGASSRRPGPDRVGAVMVKRSRIVPCEACGEPKLDLGGPHSTQLRERRGRVVIVDCVGREVQP